MEDSSSESQDHELELDAAFAEYMRRVDAGENVDQDAFLAQYPGHSNELRELFDTTDLVQQMAGSQSGRTNPPNASDTNSHFAEEDETVPPVAHVNAAGHSPHPQKNHSRSLGRYEVIKVLGQGGMGSVYLAYDPQLDRKVAIKVPLLGDSSHEVIDRFRREAKALATIEHPNICPVFDVSEVDGHLFIAMPYVDGRPLSDYIHDKKDLSIRQVVLLVRKLASALADAHKAGVIHRDLKPANVMINQRREPVIMDFGLARREGKQDKALTESGQVMGTPAYMSPEQISGQVDQMGPNCDVFSLGVMLYELLTKRLPFGNDLLSVLTAIVDNQPDPPSKHRGEIDSQLDSICLKSIAKDAGDRFKSMEEFAAVLTNYLKATGIQSEAQADEVSTSTNHGQTKQTSLEQPESTQTYSRKLVVTVIASICGLALLSALLYSLNDPSSSSGSGADTPKIEDSVELAIAPFSSAQAGRLQQEWAIRLGVDAKWKNSIGMEFSLIPPGNFLMGSTDEEIQAAMPAEIDRRDLEGIKSETPRHPVQITRAFYFGVHEVTQQQFETITGHNPSAFTVGGEKARAARGLDTSRFPVENVSWLDAVEFCNRLSDMEGLTRCYKTEGNEVTLISTGSGYRLPFEAEWEFAARAGTNDPYSFGSSEKWLNDYGWYALNSDDRTHEVGTKRANPFGLHDVHGNVFEWCNDWYDDKFYSQQNHVDPYCTTNTIGRRVSRGGAFNKPALDCRLPKRRSKTPDNRQISDGFRVVRMIPVAKP